MSVLFLFEFCKVVIQLVEYNIGSERDIRSALSIGPFEYFNACKLIRCRAFVNVSLKQLALLVLLVAKHEHECL